MGKGKSTAPLEGPTHSAAPLSTLKDPSAFGPPPKHIAVHGLSAANESAKNGGETGSARQAPPMPASRPGASPSNPSPSTGAGAPRLPPRLPPRQGAPMEDQASPPPPYHEVAQTGEGAGSSYINQGAASRLGKAGISVPGLGIGGNKQSSGQSPGTAGSSNNMSDMQSRFSKLGRNSSNDASNPPPAQGTTWAEKQAALKTAQSFRNDPNSVSLSDARGAFSTANNFRQRHGDQVRAGLDAANNLASTEGPAIVQLSDSNFDSTVFSGTPALVEFMSPKCFNCQQLAPHYEELSQQYASSASVTIAQVNCLESRQLSWKYGVRQFPKIVWFDGYSKEPEEYTGSRDLEGLQQFVQEKASVNPTAKKKPPPPPKKSALAGSGPPPIPLSSKPRIG